MKLRTRIPALLLAAALLACCVPALAEGVPGPCAPGGRVFFGAYEQDGNDANGPEPVEWLVVDVKDGAALLLSRYELAYRAYEDRAISLADGVDWERCTLREWLNGEFLRAAFTDEETAAILVTAVVNEESAEYGTPAGAGTEDRVFLPSLEEIGRWFPEPEDRRALPTFRAIIDALEWQASLSGGGAVTYGVEQSEEGPRLTVTQEFEGGSVGFEYFIDESGTVMTGILLQNGGVADHAESSGASYFLRSPGNTPLNVACVNDEGETGGTNFRPASARDGIRPALWVKVGH